MKGLEHDADALPAKPRQGVFVQGAELDAVDLNFAFIWPLKTGHDHQQRRFARAGSADDADRLALADCQIDVAQDMHASRAAAETEVDAAHRDRRKHHCSSTLKPSRPHMGICGSSSRRRPSRRSWRCFRTPPRPARFALWRLGDSLTAGYGLPPGKAFPDRLEAALRAKGWDVKVINAGVSGDTAADALARYDWSVPQDADALIVELGGNDMLRGMKPEATKKTLAAILDKARAAHLPVLLAGMRAAPNLGGEYAARVRRHLSGSGESYNVSLYPFFLEGVAGDPKLDQADGLHPNAEGVEIIVQKILPSVEALLKQANR